MRVAQVRLGIVLGILVVLLFGSVAQTYGYVDHLIRKVEHGELEECIFAMARLGELGEEGASAVPTLTNLLFGSHIEDWVLAAAAALVGIGTEEAIQVLGSALTGDDSWLSCITLVAISNSATPKLKPLVPYLTEIASSSSDYINRIVAIGAIEQIDPQGDTWTASLAEIIESGYFREAGLASGMLVLKGTEDAHRALNKALMDESTREPALEAIREFASPASKPLANQLNVIALTSVKDPGTRLAAIQALEKIEPQGDTWTPTLAAILFDYSWTEATVMVLAQIGTDDAIQALSKALMDHDFRRSTVIGLQESATPKLRPLTSQLRDIALDYERNPGMSIAAIGALERIAPQGDTWTPTLAAILFDLQAPSILGLYDYQEDAIRALIAKGTEDAMKVLAKALTEEWVYLHTLAILLDVANPNLKPLAPKIADIALSPSTSLSTVTTALETLARIDPRGAVLTQTLAEIVGDLNRHYDIRRYALDRLFDVQPSDATLLEPLVQAFASVDWGVTLTNGIVKLFSIYPLKSTKGLVDELTNLIKDPRHVEQRSAAIVALGALGPKAQSAIPALHEIVNEEGYKIEPRLEASRALGAIGGADKAIPFLMDTMEDTERKMESRRSCAEILGGIGDPAVKDLQKATKKRGTIFDKNRDSRRLACYALGIAGTTSRNPKPIVSTLTKCLKDKSPRMYGLKRLLH